RRRIRRGRDHERDADDPRRSLGSEPGGPNLTLRDTKETYPIEFRGGFSAAVLRGRGLLSAEVDQSQGPGIRFRGGSEYWVQPSFALRVGLDDQHPGGGMSYRFAGNYQFDYGVLDHPLGLT